MSKFSLPAAKPSDIRKRFRRWGERILVDVTSDCARPSHKMKGQLTYTEPGKGLERWYVYLEEGLATRLDLASEIIGDIDHELQSMSDVRFYRHVFGFGCQPVLKTSRASHIDNPSYLSRDQWRRAIMETAGIDFPEKASIIGELRPSAWKGFRIPRPNRHEDRLLFVATRRDVAMTADCLKAYQPFAAKTVWIFLDTQGGDLADAEFGSFTPGVDVQGKISTESPEARIPPLLTVLDPLVPPPPASEEEGQGT